MLQISLRYSSWHGIALYSVFHFLIDCEIGIASSHIVPPYKILRFTFHGMNAVFSCTIYTTLYPHARNVLLFVLFSRVECALRDYSILHDCGCYSDSRLGYGVLLSKVQLTHETETDGVQMSCYHITTLLYTYYTVFTYEVTLTLYLGCVCVFRKA